MLPVAIIPARGGSKEIPGKNLMNFCGLPLIAWSIIHAHEAGLEAYVSTDNEDIKECAKRFNANIIDRPHELSTDTAKMIDVLQHAVIVLKDKSYDTFILLQPTSPLRLKTDISKAIGLYNFSNAHYLFSGHKMKLIEHTPMRTQFINKNRQTIEDRLIEHGMIYIYNECYYPLGMGSLHNEDVAFYVTERWQSFEIDRIEDIDLCEFYMRKKVLCTK